MRILLDECLPKGLNRDLPGHVALTVTEAGWSGVKNGALLRLAEPSFDVFVTVDRSLTYQQNLSGRRIAIVILKGINNRFETLHPLMPQVVQALKAIQPGEVIRIQAGTP